MQKSNKNANNNGDSADNGKQGADGNMKPIRPSKAMMDALESEGLHVDWPDDIFVELKGTFTTGSGLEHAIRLDFCYAENSVKRVQMLTNILPSAFMRPGWNTIGNMN